MASSKLSALTAITSAGDDDLIYVADTADGGSTYSSKRITRGNLFSGIATESYVTTAISNLVDGAPGALDTLNELAAAMADDASFSTTITNLINANETHIDNVATCLVSIKTKQIWEPLVVLPSLITRPLRLFCSSWRLLWKPALPA